MRVLALILMFAALYRAEDVSLVDNSKSLFSVEGQIALPSTRNCAKWSTSARIFLNHGQHMGFVSQDCTFRVDHVPSGTYIVQIENADFLFEPIRVDITSKGKMRARKLTILQPNNVNTLAYPLKISARGPLRYFRKREEWRVTDMLFSPMVLMLVVPLVVMLVLPKMTANDPELKREMENMQMPKVDMPDVGEMMASFFGPAPTKKKSISGGNAQKRK